jgi:hypothetical protein
VPGLAGHLFSSKIQKSVDLKVTLHDQGGQRRLIPVLRRWLRLPPTAWL